MSPLRRLLRTCLLASASAALAGCMLNDIHAAEPQRSVSPSPTAGSQSAAGNSIEKMEYAILGGRTLVRMRFRNELQARPTVIAGHHPIPYLALDFEDTVSEIARDAIEVGERELRGLQLVSRGNRVRVIMRLARPARYEMEISGRELLVTLHRSAPAA